MGTRLIHFSDPAATDPAVVGNKFARLADLHRLAPIPAAWCIPINWFTQALGTERQQRLGDLTADMAATAGNDLTAWEWETARLLADITISDTASQCITEFTTTHHGPWAVRSSTSVEDGNTHTHAGLYDTTLNCRNASDIHTAVIACWRSFYALPAVYGRLRAGDTDPTPRIAVIVQNHVTAHLAGVAFTSPTGILIESVTGSGEQLVSGRATATRVDTTTTADLDQPYQAIRDLAQTAKNHYGHDVDIEWASVDDDTWLLQARPVTASLNRTPATAHSPIFNSRALYLPEPEAAPMSLGACASIHHAMTIKRGPAYRLARNAGIHVDDGWVTTFNGAGLRDPNTQPRWWTSLPGHVVLDLGTTARQNIMPADQLPDFLATATGADRAPFAVHTAIIRPFQYGEAGAVSHRLDDGRTIIDHSPEGLLAINRGMAATGRLTLPANPAHIPGAIQPPPRWSLTALRTIAAFTATMQHHHPGAYCEWSITSGKLTFVDYTLPNTPRANPSSHHAQILSPGTTHAAPLVTLDETTQLERLSVAPIVSVNSTTPTTDSAYLSDVLTRLKQHDHPPIVYAARPYAILSLLIGNVAGFVFDAGSSLCHLAILLREAGTPAVITAKPLCPDSTTAATIDNGTLHTT